MITINKSDYGCCDNCMSKDDIKDIKIVGVVTLCKKCRDELKGLLED